MTSRLSEGLKAHMSKHRVPLGAAASSQPLGYSSPPGLPKPSACVSKAVFRQRPEGVSLPVSESPLLLCLPIQDPAPQVPVTSGAQTPISVSSTWQDFCFLFGLPLASQTPMEIKCDNVIIMQSIEQSNRVNPIWCVIFIHSFAYV